MTVFQKKEKKKPLLLIKNKVIFNLKTLLTKHKKTCEVNFTGFTKKYIFIIFFRSL